MAGAFYLHEDEWGMIGFEPIETLADRQRVVAEAEAHAASARGAAGETIYAADAAPVALASRGITLVSLGGVLGARFVPFGEVRSEFMTYTGTPRTPFAFYAGTRAAPPDVGDDSALVIYGLRDGIHVTQLGIVHGTAPDADLLHRLGVTFRLLLCDLWRNVVVDLADRLAVQRYVDPA